MALDALLFDLDGTLIDSNEAHVDAWCEAFVAHGLRMGRDRVRQEIGKGGDNLVPSLFGDIIDRELGDTLGKAHDAAFERIADKRGLPPAPGAEALIREVRRRGIRVALATSTGAEGLEVSERASGVAWRKLFDEVTCKSDVSSSKPAPDIVHAALAKLGLSAAQCALIGDTPWDAESARRAGVAFLGITFGGVEERVLTQSGARAVYGNTADVLHRLDDALRRVAPGAAKLDEGMQRELMRAALAAAQFGMEHGEVPIGAVVARGDGQILARGHNTFNASHDVTAHAEIAAFRAAAGKIAPNARDTILVSTLEPCVMCLGAAMENAVDTVIYGLRAPKDGGSWRVAPPVSVENQTPRVVGGVLDAEARQLMSAWLERPTRNREQEPYVRELLSLV